MKHLHVILVIVATYALLGGCETVPPAEYGGQPKEVDRLAELHTQLGLGYMQEGNFEVAWQRLRRALDAEPNYPPAHNAMALLYEQMGEIEKSEPHYRRAVEINPSFSEAQTNYGSYLCRRGRTEEAEERFLKAVENPLYESPEIAYANAGVCMYTAGDLEKAETYLRRALELNPRLSTALLRMSELSLDKERYLQARGYLQRYLDVAKHTAKSLWLGVQIEQVLGDRDTVSSYAMLLKANYPDSQETRLLLESKIR